MPARSLKQIAHIEKLLSSPKGIARRFKKGQKAHNSNQVETECSHCGKKIARIPSRLSKTKRRYCSELCFSVGRLSPRTQLARQLHRKGLKLREIAEAMEISTGSVSAMLYKSKLKVTHPRVGHGRTFVKNRLPSACELCGYSRIVEIAHVTPMREGGQYTLDNCLALCPNCHHLFDHGGLTDAEHLKLENNLAARS
jgi:5-methylcytosine-specific restriction endonuclease McrA